MREAKGMNLRKAGTFALFAVLGACVSACDDEEGGAVAQKVSQRPEGYYSLPAPAPEPEPEPEPVEEFSVAPPPPPPPPPPVEDPAEIRSREVSGRLAHARKRGPQHDIRPPPSPPPSPDPLFSEDPDWTRENAPHIESGFPVDMSRKIPRHFVLTGILLDPIDTSIPNIARVLIDNPVFCGHGDKVCVPKMSVAEMRYESLRQGETRVNTRLIRIMSPSGSQIYNGDEVEGFGWGADAMGKAGIVGDIDNRVWERYGTAFITAVTAALTAAAAPTQTNSLTGGVSNATANSANALSQQIGTVTAKVLEQTINLAPIGTIDAGSSITIRLGSDIYIREMSSEKPERRKPVE